MKILEWHDFQTDSPISYILIRDESFFSNDSDEHSHDFAEVFWLDSGRCWHHINGHRELIDSNCLVFVRPSDCHFFSRYKSVRAELYNIAFKKELLDHLQSRYPHCVLPIFPPKATRPVILTVSKKIKTFLHQAFQELNGSQQNTLAIERFLINLMYMIQPSIPEVPSQRVPVWLANALHEIQAVENFTKGSSAFYKLCSKCPEHVCRELKKRTGKTVSDVVNEARLQHAANLLATSSKDVVSIALECGYESLSHFYRLFKKSYDLTPAKYRSQFYFAESHHISD